MHKLDRAVVNAVLDGAPEGIAVCAMRDPEQPVVYVNAAFEQITGYAAAEMRGARLDLLLGAESQPEAGRRIGEMMRCGEPGRALLRCCRKNGEMFWNELVVTPVLAQDGSLTHCVAYCRDAADRLKQSERGQEGVPAWLREDRLTGLSSKAWFSELLAREWRIARREGSPVSLLLFDVDALGSYIATYGKSGGDACLKRIARSIASGFRRGSDVVGLWRDGCIAVLAVHRDAQGSTGIARHAAQNVQRIAEMRIHHPRSPLQKHITVTAGLATVRPGREEEEPLRLIERAEQALAEGKRERRGELSQAPD